MKKGTQQVINKIKRRKNMRFRRKCTEFALLSAIIGLLYIIAIIMY